MFTGIVEEVGQIKSIEWGTNSARFYISASRILEDAKKGDSICVNGCCLTISDLQRPFEWSCDIVQESLNRTTFRALRVGDLVNLERAVRCQDRLGGHLVQGHVDEVGVIQAKQALENGSWWVTIGASSALLRYVVCKGSVAVDGISLTVAALAEEGFSFAMIPHTAQITTLGNKQVGDFVNVEVDLMAKYIERFLVPFQSNLSNRTR